MKKDLPSPKIRGEIRTLLASAIEQMNKYGILEVTIDNKDKNDSTARVTSL